MEKGERLKRDLFSTLQKAPAAPDPDDIRTIIDRVIINSRKFKETFKQIVKDLHVLNEHQDEVEKITGQNFKQFIKNLNISRSHLSEINRAYELCIEYKRPEYFETQDIKKLVSIARVEDPGKQKTLFNKVSDLTREEIEAESKNVRQSNISGKGPDAAILDAKARDYLDKYLSRYQGRDRVKAITRLIRHLETALKRAERAN